MSQSSRGFSNYDPEEDDNNLPLQAEDRASTRINSPNFELPAEESAPTPSPSPDLGNSPFASALSDFQPEAPVQDVQDAPEAPRLKGAENPELGGAIQAFQTADQPAPQMAPPRAGYEDAWLHEQDRLNREGLRQSKATKAGASRYLRAQGVEMETLPDGSDAIASHEDGAPRFKSALSAPFQDETGNWRVRSRNDRGDLSDVEIADTKGLVHFNPDTGDQYFVGSDKKPVMLGTKDARRVEQLQLQESRHVAAGQMAERELQMNELHASLSDSSRMYGEMLNSGAGDPKARTVKALQNAVSAVKPLVDAGTAEPEMMEQYQADSEALAKYNAQHPEFGQLKSAIASGSQTLAAYRRERGQDLFRKRMIGASPVVSAAVASLLPDGLLAQPQGPGDASLASVDANTAAESAQTGSPQALALPGVLQRMKASGVKTIDGHPIDAAIAMAQAPRPVAPKAAPEPEAPPPEGPGWMSNLVGSALNRIKTTGLTMAESALRGGVGTPLLVARPFLPDAVKARIDSQANELAKWRQQLQGVETGAVSAEDAQVPGALKAGTGLINPERKDSWEAGLGHVLPDVAGLLAAPEAAIPTFLARGMAEGQVEASDKGENQAMGALKGGGKTAVTLAAFGAAGKLASKILPSIAEPSMRFLTQAGIATGLNAGVDTVVNSLFGGNAIPQTPAEWVERGLFALGFGALHGWHEAKLPDRLAAATNQLALSQAARKAGADPATVAMLDIQDAQNQDFLAQHAKLVEKLQKSAPPKGEEPPPDESGQGGTNVPHGTPPPNVPRVIKTAADFEQATGEAEKLKDSIAHLRDYGGIEGLGEKKAQEDALNANQQALAAHQQSVTESLPPELHGDLAKATGADSAPPLDPGEAGFMAAHVGRTVRDLYLSPESAKAVDETAAKAGHDAPVAQYVADQHVGRLVSRDLADLVTGAKPIGESKARALIDLGLLAPPAQEGGPVTVTHDALKLLPPALRANPEAQARLSPTPDAANVASLVRGGQDYLGQVLRQRAAAKEANKAQKTPEKSQVKVTFTDKSGQQRETVLPAKGNEEQAKASAESRVEKSGNKVLGSEIVKEAKKGEEKKLSSTQITLAPADAKPFIDFANSIPEEELYHEEPGKGDSYGPEYGREDKPHVTALYGIHGQDSAHVEAALRKTGQGPIKVRVGKLSLFENADKPYDVLKADIESPDLHELNAALRKLPHSSDFPDYHPHLTIAYLKKGMGAKYAGDTRFEGDVITVPKLTFSDADRNHTAIDLPARKPIEATSPSQHVKPTPPGATNENQTVPKVASRAIEAHPASTEKPARVTPPVGASESAKGASLTWENAKLTDFQPHEQAAIMEVEKEFKRNAALFRALGVKGFQPAKFDQETGGVSMGADGVLRADGRQLAAHFDFLKSEGVKPEEWARRALQEEAVHLAQFKAAGPNWRAYYEKVWADVPEEMRSKAAEAYAGFEELGDAEKAGEVVRMVIQGRWKGSITESIRDAIKQVVDYLRGFDLSKTPLLKEAIDRAQAVLDKAEASTAEKPPAPVPRNFTIPYAPLGSADLVDFVVENGGVEMPPKGQRSQEHDDAPSLPGIYRQLVTKAGKGKVDEMAQMAFDAHLIRDGHPSTFWSALDDAVRARVSLRAQEKAQAAREKAGASVADDQAAAFHRDTAPETGGTAIHVENLAEGSTVEIGGEQVKVRAVDPETGDVTLEDGKKYGIQTVAHNEVIYAEHIGEESADFLPPEDVLSASKAQNAKLDKESGGLFDQPPPKAVDTKSPPTSSQRSRPETYVQGDRAEYTGETRDLHGGKFYVLEVMEGARKGKEAVTQRSPAGEDPNTERVQREWREQQAGAKRLSEAEKAIPHLRPGEKGTSELFQGEDQPFNLAGEKGVDWQKREAEKAAAEKASAEAKAKQDRDQGGLFASRAKPEKEPVRIGNAEISPPGIVRIGGLAAARAYHGTPHDVDKFSTEKIGTGEGAQVYGWGLYFAENRETADFYRDALTSERKQLIDQLPKDRVNKDYGKDPVAHAAALILNHGLEGAKKFNSDRAEGSDFRREVGATLNSIDPKKVTQGNTYEVHLDVEPETLLDWDNPLSEQSAKVKAAIDDLSIVSEFKRMGDNYGGARGSDFYYAYTRAHGRPESASGWLSHKGIPGIRYADQGSRGDDRWITKHPQGGENEFADEKSARAFAIKNPEVSLIPPKKTYNYVIFDESKIKITHKNGEPVSVGGALAASRLNRTGGGAPEKEAGTSNLTAGLEKQLADAKMMRPDDPAGFLREMGDRAKAKGDTAAAKNLHEAAIQSAYRDLAAESKFPSVRIADLAKKSGLPLEQVKEYLHQQWRAGKVQLESGDWSLSSEETRKGAITVNGDKMLLARFPEPQGGLAASRAPKDQERARNFKAWTKGAKFIREGESFDEVKPSKPVVIEGYHGTTHEFDVADPSRANVENDFGKGFYVTNHAEDVARNYAGEGPDLTNRIERKSELVDNEIEYLSQDELVEQYGVSAAEAALLKSKPKYGSAEYSARRSVLLSLARKDLVTHGGATMKVYVRMENPLKLGGKEEYWDANLNEDTGEVSGKMAKFVEAIRDESSRYDEADIESGEFDNLAIEGGRPSEAIKAAKKALPYAQDENGEIATNEIIRAAIERMGYDGIIDTTVNEKFGSQRQEGKPMAGMEPNTAHIIAFKSEQVKSATGNAGTFDRNNPSMLAASALPKSVRAAHASVVEELKARDTKGDISRKFDAGKTVATNEGEQAKNSIRQDFGAKVTPTPEQAKDLFAARLVVDSGGTRAGLLAERTKILSGPNPKLNKTFLAAVDHALAHLDRLDRDAAGHRKLANENYDRLTAMGYDIGKREHYVGRVTIAPEETQGVNPLFTTGTGKGDNPKGSHKARAFDTIGDAVAAGYDPGTYGIHEADGRMVRHTEKLFQDQKYLDWAKNIAKAPDGKPIIGDLEQRDTPKYRRELYNHNAAVDDWITNGKKGPRPIAPRPEMAVPRGYAMVQMMGRPTVVHQQFAGLFRALYGDSAIRQSTIGRGLLKTAAVLKHGLLFFDTFHAGRMLLKGFAGSAGVGYRRGLALLEYAPKDLARAVKRGEITAQEADFAAKHRAAYDELAGGGLNIAGVADNLLEQARLHIPGISTYNHWLFQKLSRGIMIQGSLKALERNVASGRYKTRSDAVRQTVKEMNEYFGNMQSQGIFKSRTLQDLARLVFLAPNWVESQARYEGRAYAQAVARKGNILAGNSSRALATGFVALMAANQVLNYITRGQSTFENKEEDHKLDAWLPGGKRGFWFGPLEVAAEYLHAGIKYAAQHENAVDIAAHVASNKLSPLARGLKEAATGRDYAGRHFLNETDRFRSAASDMLPIPMLANAGLEKDPRQPLGFRATRAPGALEKQVLQSAGMKVSAVQSPRTQMFALAHPFRPDGGKTDSAGQYTELRRALDNDDTGAAKSEIQWLIGQGKNLATISEAVGVHKDGTIHPELFTGGKEREREMLATFTPAQKALYQEAQADHAANARKFMALRKDIGKPAPIAPKVSLGDFQKLDLPHAVSTFRDIATDQRISKEIKARYYGELQKKHAAARQ